MRSWKISPLDAVVAQTIDCYWFLEKTSEDTGVSYPKLNPDPAAHLILSCAQQPFHYEHGDYLAAGTGSHLILPYKNTYTLDHSQPFRVLGIKLKVGALYSLPLTPTHPLLDKVIPLDIQNQLLISPGNEASLFNQDIENPEAYRDILDRLLQPLIAQVKEDKHNNLVRKVLALFTKDNLIELALAQVGDKLGCSQRTIERSFVKVTGLTLKQYHSMQRLEAMLDYLHHLPDNNLNWSEIALTFGFSDQPHLIRYLKGTLGSTPGQYAEARNLTIDAYGNFE